MTGPDYSPNLDWRRRSMAEPASRPDSRERRHEIASTKKGAGRARVLVVTPEITYLPSGQGNLAQRMSAKAGGLADVSASLVGALANLGAKVHVALPNYRCLFHLEVPPVVRDGFDKVHQALPRDQVHLAEDRVFYHRAFIYSPAENLNLSLAFQREVINHIIPEVQPELIHCNDWMTGLIPAVARRRGIKCLFTVHNIHTEKVTLAHIEDRGIDAAGFWESCYYLRPPHNYEETREHNPLDLLASGIFAADHVSSVSPTFLSEVVDGRHDFVPGHISHELWQKCHAGCASGILNAPDPTFDPRADPYLDEPLHYGPEGHVEGKARCKARLQEALGLRVNPGAPLLFWPSRLDPVQKGPQLFTGILHQLTADYRDLGLQVAVVASGEFQRHFRDIVGNHGLHGCVAVADFSEPLSHLGYAAADFMVMPSLFEPCGLPQMIGPKYGTLPVAHDTGGIHDTVEHLHSDPDGGNGFLFEHFTSAGLRWAVDEALRFHRQPATIRSRHITRIMREAAARFNHATTAAAYIRLYEQMLQRPVTAEDA